MNIFKDVLKPILVGLGSIAVVGILVVMVASLPIVVVSLGTNTTIWFGWYIFCGGLVVLGLWMIGIILLNTELDRY